MAFTVAEREKSRRKSDDAAERAYVLIWDGTGDNDEAAAYAAMATFAPAGIGSLPLLDLDVEEQSETAGVWDGTARYGREDLNIFERREVGTVRRSFDTTGGVQRIMQSRLTVAVSDVVTNTWSEGGVASPFGGAIGVTPDSVEGVDTPAPVFAFNFQAVVAGETVTDAYVDLIFRYTGCMNSSDYHGLEPGECLFLGASGQERDDGDYDITFAFAGSPNATEVIVGDIAVPEKKGWDYLWVYYQETEGTAPGGLKYVVRKPVIVLVERVHLEADLNDLGV